MKKFKFISALITINLLFLVQFSFAQNMAALAPNPGVTDAPVERCGTDEAVQQRIANDPAYAAFYNQHISDIQAGAYRSVDPCATPITVTLAFHFDESFSCADPDCLTSEVEEAVDALNLAFGDNTQDQLVQDLNASCPAGYPLSTVSTGTCITFCLANSRPPFSAQGLDSACDPAITIGSFCGGVSYGGPMGPNPACDGGSEPYYSGILNVFVVSDNGSGVLGIADAIGAQQANGNGVTVLGTVFGADGGPCISGGPINTSNQYGGGATLAHEVGHYLGLPHIWGDINGGGCGGDDGISDTPIQNTDNGALFPCPTVTPGTTTCTNLPMSCGVNNYYHNFMDYTGDNCLVMFTQEQAQIMNTFANSLFGNSASTCFTDPVELTSLCEQTVCDPLCDVLVTFDAVCDADELNYTVTVTIAGGTGPFDVNETVFNDPSMINTVLDSGVAAGTYTYSFPAGANANIFVVDNGVADCLDGEFIVDPCTSCDFDVQFDLDNVVCQDFGGTLLPTIPTTVTDGVGIVWIDQDGNPTFDAGVDIDITAGLNLGIPASDITFTIYDGGIQGCFKTFTIEAADFSCEGLIAGDLPQRVCTLMATADAVNYTCNGDGTATVEVMIDRIAGNLSVVGGAATQTSLMGDSATYEVIVPVGAGCALTTVTFSDDGSDVSQDTGVSITAPANIANDLTNVGTNVDGDNDGIIDFGIDINTVSTPVCGTLAQPDDGTAPATNFCEPDPPATPTAAQCAALSGNIAIIDRGTCAFTVKAENAQACGATAVIICNCDANLADCNSDNNDQVSNMVGTSINPITIPTIFLSYNQCQEIYANLANGPVDMCIGAPQDIPCERTVNIDACALLCDTPVCSGLASAPALASPVELCTGDGPVDVCFDMVDATEGLIFDVSIDGGAATVITATAGAAPNELCIQLPMVENLTCDVTSNTITFNSITCNSGEAVPGPASPSLADDLNAGGGIVINVYPTLTVNTTGDNLCGTLSADLLAADGTVCSTAAGSPFMCIADGDVLNYDFTGDVGFIPTASCALPTLSGTITCAMCGVDCTLTEGSMISTADPTRICIDGIEDPINVTVDVDSGGTGVWVITDAAAIILALPAGPPFDLDGAGAGQCLIWYVNTEDGMFSPMVGDDAAAAVAASDCTFLSNAITVDRIEVTGATISSPAGDPITICTDDGIDEPIDVTIDDAGIGANGAWVITDSNGIILDLPAAPPFTLDGAGVGTCLIWWVNFDDPNFAPSVGDDAAALVTAATCAALSNPIMVVREMCITDASIVNIEDPCDCASALNLDLDGDGVADIFYEEITITAVAGITDWVQTLTFATGTALDATGAPATPAIVDNGDGTYTVSFYFNPGDSYTASYDSASEGILNLSVSGGGCMSCGPCEDAITGSVTTDEPTCDLTGAMVEIVDAMGNPVAGSPVTIDAAGSYLLAGPFPCGTYTATLVAGSFPQCYADLNGTTGPFEFAINGDGTADGANFTTLPQVPTLSQWGLISLALLLMIFGAVKISATSLTLTRIRK